MTIQPITTPGTVATVTPPPAVTDITSAGLQRLADWVQAAQHAHQLVAPLVGTPFVPEAYKPRVDPRATDQEKAAAYETAVATATAAVLQGISLELDPLTSLQQIYVVHGRPGMYAKMMVALVQSRGHEVWTEESTDTRCVVSGRRRGTEQIERVTVTMDQARRAGWVARNKNYESTPSDMLWARAASRVCDRIASDVLKGLRTVEDIQDESASDQGATSRAGKTRTVSAPKRRPELVAPAPATVQASAPQAPAARQVAPTDDDLLGYEQDASTQPQESISGQQIAEQTWRAINAAFVDLGVKGDGQKEARLQIIGHVVGRDVSRGNELTAADGELVLTTLADAGPRVVWDVLGGRFGHTDPDVVVVEQADVVDDGSGLPDPSDENDPWAGADQ